MRVEVAGEFYVRVMPEADAVAAAARTLGHRTMNPDSLKDLVQGRFVDALGAVAAEMTMEHMHEKRGEYVRAVKARVADVLPRTAWSSRRCRSPISTRPTSSSSIRRTPSTPRA